MKRVTRDDLECRGVVSLWLGSIELELQWEDYVRPNAKEKMWNKSFHDDFGLGRKVLEPSVSMNQDHFLVPAAEHDVRFLLECMEWSPQWIDEAVIAAEARGWRRATVAFALYDLKYDPAQAKTGSQPLLTFIGSFSYDPEQDPEPVRSYQPPACDSE